MAALTLPLAIVATACLPVVVAAIFCADEIVDRVVCSVGERLDARQERRVRRRFDQLIAVNGVGSELELPQPDQDDQPPIEQIAADLHRLGRERLRVVDRSQVRHEAVTRAYDERLRQACGRLAVVEHLAELDGVDLEIERVRVEGELQAVGLALPAVAVDRLGSGGE